MPSSEVIKGRSRPQRKTAGKRLALITDQKVGGSSPSERAEFVQVNAYFNSSLALEAFPMRRS